MWIERVLIMGINRNLFSTNKVNHLGFVDEKRILVARKKFMIGSDDWDGGVRVEIVIKG